MITKGNIFLILLIILVSSASVYALDFSGNLTYSGQYNLSEENLSNTLNLDLNYIHSFTDKVSIEGDLVIKYSDKSSTKPLYQPGE